MVRFEHQSISSFAVGLTLAVGLAISITSAADFEWNEQTNILMYKDNPVFEWVTPDYDPSNYENTYKVFHHLYDHEGRRVTKGPGGLYTHHRGVFLGWNKTVIDGKNNDFWHCKNKRRQEHGSFLQHRILISDDSARLAARTNWIQADNGEVVNDIREVRIREIAPGTIEFDYRIRINTLEEKVEFKGDLHHAGFQVRFSSAFEPDSQFAEEITYIKDPDNKWTVSHFPWHDGIEGSSMHMAHPENQPEEYSTREYGRYGAFLTNEVQAESSWDLRFRFILRTQGDQIDQEEAEEFYAQYSQVPFEFNFDPATNLLAPKLQNQSKNDQQLFLIAPFVNTKNFQMFGADGKPVHLPGL